MLVDDSAVIRGLISRALEKDPDVHIAASVHNGQAAVDAIERIAPDVVLLDIEMPVMDGLSALPLLLQKKPGVKVLMCSTLSKQGATVTMRALELGATDYITKPTARELSSAEDFQTELVRLVRALGGKPAFRSVALPPGGASAGAPAPAGRNTTGTTSQLFRGADVKLRNDSMAYKGKPDILAIGSSTGGPQALFEVIKSFQAFDIPIVITQHMPKTFTHILAQHIQQHCGITCHEGAQGMALEKGNAYVAPGGFHMLFRKDGLKVTIDLNDGPQENFCKPAVDPMMRSLIEIYGSKILAVILTGMGYDGQKGCAALVERGGRVVAQDEETSVVWGMPGAVATTGLCSAVLPLKDIGPWVRRSVMGV
ncbi:MAG: chemotaxis response regulator protein-glutamate methylesterase [Alphaproteobacteria bacterium]|nr:chemotaxis response regulator protein-glutamate methylesterase [Alphaproteobacteria bacterium]